MTSGILTSRRTKNTLYKASLDIQDPAVKKKYIDFRNVYNKTVRAMKKSFYDNDFLKNKNNIRESGSC